MRIFFYACYLIRTCPCGKVSSYRTRNAYLANVYVINSYLWKVKVIISHFFFTAKNNILQFFFFVCVAGTYFHHSAYIGGMYICILANGIQFWLWLLLEWEKWYFSEYIFFHALCVCQNDSWDGKWICMYVKVLDGRPENIST